MSLVLMSSLSSAGLKASTLSLKDDSSDGKADTMTKAKAMNKKACNALIEKKLLELILVTCHLSHFYNFQLLIALTKMMNFILDWFGLFCDFELI